MYNTSSITKHCCDSIWPLSAMRVLTYAYLKRYRTGPLTSQRPKLSKCQLAKLTLIAVTSKLARSTSLCKLTLTYLPQWYSGRYYLPLEKLVLHQRSKQQLFQQFASTEYDSVSECQLSQLVANVRRDTHLYFLPYLGPFIDKQNS